MYSFQPRQYQQTIANTASLHNTLVVLPTGLGKTNIAIMLAAKRIAQYSGEKVLLLAPTKPLVDQHFKSFSEQLPDAEALGVVLNGKVSPEKRAKEFQQASFIFSTPQTIENDLLSDRISLRDVSLLIVDEAHRAVGDYSYVYIVKQYRKQAFHERILALTASPGSDKQTIQEIVHNVGAEKIEIRSVEDADVKPYVQDTETTYLEVDLSPEFVEVKKILQRVIVSRLAEIKHFGAINSIELNKTQLLLAQKELQSKLRQGHAEPWVWRCISLLAEVMKAQHALELVETQGVDALMKYFMDLQKQAERGQSKAVKNLVSDPDYKSAVFKAGRMQERGMEHPKLLKLISLVKLELLKNPDAKIIVFNQYRDMAVKIVESVKGSKLFVGQQKKGETGMSQKEQQEILKEFRDGIFPVLVATTVGEEGLDIPSVDLVVFYEPVPSAIRTIQRRGRTGRHDTGKVVVLIARNTRDVGYRWSAFHKEKRMYRALREMSTSIVLDPPKQSKLDDFQEEGLTIYADSREKGSGVLKELQNSGCKLVLKNLDIGDYLLSKRVCVEFKQVDDFVNSIIDGRLINQLRNLTQYQRPLIIIQGNNWYEQRNIHPNAIRGMMSAITVSYGIPILVSQNDKDTAALLYTIARREKEGGISSPDFIKSRSSSPREDLLNVVSMLPNVGPVLAPKLLDRFGSLKDLINASVEDLKQVEGVGNKKAQELFDVFNKKF